MLLLWLLFSFCCCFHSKFCDIVTINHIAFISTCSTSTQNLVHIQQALFSLPELTSALRCNLFDKLLPQLIDMQLQHNQAQHIGNCDHRNANATNITNTANCSAVINLTTLQKESHISTTETQTLVLGRTTKVKSVLDELLELLR